MKVNFNYRDLRNWLLTQENVSVHSIMEAFSLNERQAKSALRGMVAIGEISARSYEILSGFDDLVEIHSLTSIWDRVERDPNPNSIAVLSFADDDCHFPDFAPQISHYRVVCPDVDYPSETDFESFFNQSDEVAKWITEQVALGKKVLCQCEYGISRSAASAAAILEVFHGDGIQIFSDFEFKPNKLIYKKLLTSLLRLQR